jgi:L-threonylcarbamoyladenylate synthase
VNLVARDPRRPDPQGAAPAHLDAAPAGLDSVPAGLDSVERAVERLAEGGLVAYPTETVWGLAADASNPAAVERLRSWKGRAEAQPISLLAADSDGLALPAAGRALAAAFWPGPLTLVAPARLALASGIARQDGAVGWRCSPHVVAAALARAAADAGLGPLTATSLNHSGAPPARTRAEAAALCGAGPESPALLEVAGPDAGGGEPSTVVDVTGPAPRVLRQGAISDSAIRACIEERRCA